MFEGEIRVVDRDSVILLVNVPPCCLMRCACQAYKIRSAQPL